MKKISTAYITKIALLTAISFILYAFCKFNLPFMFPSFLEIQISDLPAIIGGFALGPVSGCIIIVLKCCLKMAMTSTACVGEVVDIIVGIAFVLPASLIYKHKKDKKHAVIALAVGSAIATVTAMICNYLIAVPFYVTAFFGGSWEPLIGMLRVLYPSITRENFYALYLFAGVFPFNLLRLLIVSGLTLLIYKKLSVILKKEFSADLNAFDATKTEQIITVKNLKGTQRLARQMARILTDGDVILLNGDLGAGKTTFTAALCKSLGVKDSVTSPTFTILNQYSGKKFKINHLDMYRIENADELYETGIYDEIEGEGISVIEWNKYSELESKAIKIDITVSGEIRKFDIILPQNKIKRNNKRKGSSADATDVLPSEDAALPKNGGSQSGATDDVKSEEIRQGEKQFGGTKVDE
ncbi:MAG: tRNA (adenosine(37)-N6)-threonylcarbamoyltransferase complex ATPase subunit type 1 TsaE [Christensenellales bacterium]